MVNTASTLPVELEPPVDAPLSLTKGQRTRLRLLEAAETVFGERGFYEASIVEITQHANVAQGTFYVYFPSKSAIFSELVHTRGHELRAAMADATAGASDRATAERLGLIAFLDWVRGHPAIYRIVKQAEWVDREEFEQWYLRIAAGYSAALQTAANGGEIDIAHVEAVTWALMGIGDLVGMRFAVWDGEVPDEVIETVVAFIHRGLGVTAPNATRTTRTTKRTKGDRR